MDECWRIISDHRSRGALALPNTECALDLIALVGTWRFVEHRSVPEIHAMLRQREVPICERTLTNLIARYEQLVALRLTDLHRRLPALLKQGKVVLAVDGLQPDVGHEILWIVREVLSGEVLVAKSLLSATTKDLSELLEEVKMALPPSLTVAGVISDGQTTIRNAVAQVFVGVPHQLCQFHYLKEAAKPIYEADTKRPAKPVYAEYRWFPRTTVRASCRTRAFCSVCATSKLP